MQRKELGIPGPPQRSGDTNWEADVTRCPFVFVADEAFSLTYYCMKPFAQRQLAAKSEFLTIAYPDFAE